MRSAGSCPSPRRASSTRCASASPTLEVVEEGKGRVNQAAAYSIVFRASRNPRLYGRLVLLPQPLPGARDGVKLLLLANPAGGAGKAGDVGTRGRLKTPYRSFRFGTENL